MGEIWTLGSKSYRDAIGLLQRAGSTVAIAVLILAASGFISIGVDRLINTMLGRQVAGTLLNIVGIWFAAPYLVSLYRLLLNNQTVPPETLRNTQATRRFFAWSAVLAFITAAPGYFFAAVMPPGLTSITPENAELTYLVWPTFFMLIAVWIFAIRTITLVPAAAVDADAGIAAAVQQTRGRFWFVVGAVTVPLLPVMLLGMLLTLNTGGILSIVFSIGMALAVLILAVTVSANLYRWLLDNPK